eukprot:15259848-Heterocapsa_arctica.AAC.1
MQHVTVCRVHAHAPIALAQGPAMRAARWVWWARTSTSWAPDRISLASSQGRHTRCGTRELEHRKFALSSALSFSRQPLGLAPSRATLRRIP